MSRMVVILNPASGPLSRRKRLPEIAAALASQGLCAEIVEVIPGQDVARLARDAAASGAAIVVAAGGDGTVSAVASAVIDRDVAIGILPLGTFNHCARDLRIPLDINNAVAVLGRGRTDQLDAGEVNGRIFVNNSSIGIYPSFVVVRERELRKGRRKWLALWLAVLAQFRRFPFWTVRVEAEHRRFSQKTPFVFVGNNEYEIQGLEIGRRVNLNRGLLFVYVAAPTSRLGFLWMALTARFGHLDRSRNLQVIAVEEAWIETRRKRIRVATDGEVRHMRSPLHYRTRPKSLRVIVP